MYFSGNIPISILKRSIVSSSISSLSAPRARVFPIVAGANFILYGPIEHAKTAYFYCGLADAYVAYSSTQEFRVRPLEKEHPLFKIFK